MAPRRRSQRTEADRELEPQMQNSDSETVFDVGMMYYDQRNYHHALTYFRRAAADGYSPAFCKLGRMYESGEGVQTDNERAFQSYQSAIEIDNNAEAQNNIGTMCLEGLGIQQNIIMARYWFRLSASQGCPEAAYNLGAFFESDEIMHILKRLDNMQDIYIYYRYSANMNDAPPRETREVLRGLSVDEMYQRIAANWYQRALELGDEDAQEALDRLALGNIRPANN